ncbi:MAG: AAA family ATPase [Cytophagales bacterium]|nr:MAG: AAA family ATPase [Cytophagales bacterium]
MNNNELAYQNPLLKNLEKIANEFKNCELNEINKNKITQKVQEEIKIAATFLHCSEDETWLFAVLFALNISGRDTDLESLNQYLNSSPFYVVSLIPLLEGLANKRLIIKNTGYDSKIIATRFQISSFVFNAISLNKAVPKHHEFNDVYEVIERINEMICDRERNNLSTDDLVSEAKNLLLAQKNYPMIQKLLALDFSDEDTLLMIYLCYVFANETGEADIERYIYYVYDSIGAKIRAKKHLYSGQSILIDEEWVSFQEDNFYGGKEIALTDKSVELLFAEDIKAVEKGKSFSAKYYNVFLPDKIKISPLFFNQQEQKQTKLLKELLIEENYQKTIQKFKYLNYPASITALLYGDPGTGKTQIGYNIAHHTQRPLLMVDIASIRDKYVGESEKKIKQVFKQYKQACEYYPTTPILFFNESDALISKRFEVNSSVDQMNNSMQNILLQELEDFEGILIATSNLNVNLDNAFERRFLYKIRFDKPDTATRKLIWKNKIPELSAEDAEHLAEQYVLTGGQINNIVRKTVLENILQETPLTVSNLLEYCEQEIINHYHRNKVGF